MSEPIRITPADLLVDARARLGEGAIWDDRAQAFYWTDIEGRTISRWREGDAVTVWPMPDRVGSFALCEQVDQLLLGLAKGVALINLASGAMSAVVPVEADMPDTRINDGRCDPQGRFVFGMYHRAERAEGGFWRVGPDLQVERLPLPAAGVANSICFSPDGRWLYCTDTPSREILRREYFADGRIGAPELFARLSEADGYPDGSCVDAEGGVWNARWQGRAVVRYSAAGEITDRVELPTDHITCPAFGGPTLDRLFITSARAGLDEAALAAQPLAGGVFSASPVGRRGLPERRFATTLRV
jgi:L-arabinonolactonase